MSFTKSAATTRLGQWVSAMEKYALASFMCQNRLLLSVITATYPIFCVVGGPLESFSMRYSPWVGTLWTVHCPSFKIWPQLFKGWLASSIGQITIRWKTQLILITLIPRDSDLSSVECYPPFEQLRPDVVWKRSLSYDPHGPARAFIAKLFRKSLYEGRARWRKSGWKKPPGLLGLLGTSRDVNWNNNIINNINPDFSVKKSDVSEHSDSDFITQRKMK